ncbi:MAG: signal peptidase II [Solirubrobacteraceae bacterium]
MSRPVPRAVAVAGAVVALDQATKALVRAHLDRGDSDPILPGVTLVNTRNRGVAFGLLQDGGALVAVVTAVALLALLAFFALNRSRALAWLPTGLLVGGAVGNIVDRARGEGVTDFVKLPLWPAFNVADMAITFGVLALVYVLERRRG